MKALQILGSAGILFGMALLAGCSTNEVAPASTAAIAPQDAAAVATATPAVPAAPPLPPVASASCETLKGELAGYVTDKLPQRLSQFSQSKYTPQDDELGKFKRYVEVSQAMKSRCATVKAETPAVKPKKKVEKVTQKAATTTKTAVAAATTVTKKPAAAVEIIPAVVPTAPAATTSQADVAVEGVTTTVMPE